MSATMIALCVGMLVADVFFGPSPMALQFWSDRFRPAPFKTQSFHWATYRVTDHHRALRSIIAEIPENAIVSTQQFLMPRLASRRGIMIFPQFVSRDGAHYAEYVLLDTTNNDLPRGSPAYVAVEDMAHVREGEQRWRLLSASNGYMLYEQK